MLTAWALIRERPHASSLVGAGVGFAGVALLVLRGTTVDPVGVAASFGAVAMSSLGFVLVKRWTSPVDLLTFTAWQLVAGGLVLLPIALIAEGGPPTLDPHAVGGFAYLGLVATGLAYIVWFRGLRRLPAAAVSLVGLLNPVAGTLIGVTLAGEAFGLAQGVGMVMVLGGILVGQPAVAARFHYIGRSGGLPVASFVDPGRDDSRAQFRGPIHAASQDEDPEQLLACRH